MNGLFHMPKKSSSQQLASLVCHSQKSHKWQEKILKYTDHFPSFTPNSALKSSVWRRLDMAQLITICCCWSSYKISLILDMNVADPCEKHIYSEYSCLQNQNCRQVQPEQESHFQHLGCSLIFTPWTISFANASVPSHGQRAFNMRKDTANAPIFHISYHCYFSSSTSPSTISSAFHTHPTVLCALFWSLFNSAAAKHHKTLRNHQPKLSCNDKSPH